MVTIKKNGKTKTVTRSAFENFYKNSGWAVLNGSPSKNKSVKEKNVEKVAEETSDEDWDSVIEEEETFNKPLEEMTRKELEAKAKELGIDLTGLGKTAQIREAIRVYLE